MFDGYLHCGRAKYQPWETVAVEHGAAGITGGLLVHHFGDVDNEYLVAAAHALGANYRCAVIADANRADWYDDLARAARNERVVGVRVMVAKESNWAPVAHAASSLGLDVLAFVTDPLASACAGLKEWAAAHPEVHLLLTHLAASPGHPPDEHELLRLADSPNVVLGVSGFHMWSDYPYEAASPLAARLLQAFAGRAVWGSNYPLCGTGAGLVREVELAQRNPWELAPGVVEALLDDTGRSLWCEHPRPSPAGSSRRE